MSLFGFRLKKYDDDTYNRFIRPAEIAAGLNPDHTALVDFTGTQHLVAELLKVDPLVSAAKELIGIERDSSLSNGEKLASAALGIAPKLVDFFAKGGVKAEVGELTGLATTFVQEVHNLHFSTTIGTAIKAGEAAVASLAHPNPG